MAMRVSLGFRMYGFRFSLSWYTLYDVKPASSVLT
jgi:hypothetical protein